MPPINRKRFSAAAVLRDVVSRVPVAAVHGNDRKLLRGVDLTATLVFAVEGAAVGIGSHLDIFGVVVVACVSAMGGGVIRDVLIGDTPPAALTDPFYIPVAAATGLVTFVFYQPIGQIPAWFLTGLDAAGLGLFWTAGALKATDYGLRPVSAAFMGTLTAVGGGHCAT